ncbi:amidase [Noviherbaspirillum aerium]|uniref:amidase n=1 Tax=Noviherbaspirillum aerium TaxID=2588497 RepID=UPI00124BE1F6|nr:amidase [Noviherbaspirillum aerium]
MSLPPNTLDYWRAELDSGRVSSRELTELALQAALNSSEAPSTFIAVHAATARATADAMDLLRAASVPLPALAGIPISIKDLFDEAGQITRAGSVVRNDAAPAQRDSTVVERLRRAGAVIIGRTNMTEFAYSGLGLNPHYGTPRNPWDRQTGRIPGGSSSGAAISMTEGAAAAAIGTDTGGSVRIPSALCGLTGFKPTARRVPLDGVLPLSPSLDSIGPLARSVSCCAQLDAVLSGNSHMNLRMVPLANRCLAVPRTLVFDGIDATVAAAFDAACSTLSRAGARLVEIEVPEFAELAHINRQGGFIAAESWAWHADMLATREAEYDPRVAARIRRGAAIGAVDYITLLSERRRWIAGVQQRLADTGCDAFLLPTVPVVAPPIAALRDSDDLYGSTNLLMLRNPTLINFVDGCALSVPCHKPGDAPVGLMIAGLHGHDEQVLRLGVAVEAALSHAA